MGDPSSEPLKRAPRWWQRPSAHVVAAALIAVGAGIGLAIGVSLLAVGLTHSGGRHAPPILLSSVWSAAAALSFAFSVGYLLVEPRIAQLLRMSAIPAIAMLCSVLVLVVRNA
jgi:hypothetical protein